MSKAYFAKYSKNLSVNSAFETINNIKKHSNKPIEYQVITEVNCDKNELNLVFEKGSIINLTNIAMLGVSSIQSKKGIWQCIVLNDGKESLIIYTGGTSDILYYSLKCNL